MVAAFAMLANCPVVVYNIWEEHAHVLCPPRMGYILEKLTSHRKSAVRAVARTPLVLWSNGGHYQAVVPCKRFRMSAAAALSFRYTESNVVDKTDLVLICD
jgi:hypothetical protein